MLGLIKKMFIVLLTRIVTASNHTKSVWLSNQKYMTQPTLSQEFHYYPIAVKLDRCVGSCNTLNDLSKNVFENMCSKQSRRCKSKRFSRNK